MVINTPTILDGLASNCDSRCMFTKDVGKTGLFASHGLYLRNINICFQTVCTENQYFVGNQNNI